MYRICTVRTLSLHVPHLHGEDSCITCTASARWGLSHYMHLICTVRTLSLHAPHLHGEDSLAGIPMGSNVLILIRRKKLHQYQEFYLFYRCTGCVSQVHRLCLSGAPAASLWCTGCVSQMHGLRDSGAPAAWLRCTGCVTQMHRLRYSGAPAE